MIIDDFLPQDQLKFLQETFMWSLKVPYYLHNTVTDDRDSQDKLDIWYGTNVIYNHPHVPSPYFEDVDTIFRERFEDFGAWLRIKANFYPHTKEIIEHQQHGDGNFSHGAAIFCLNTCDGYTRISQDILIKSNENRIYFFDGSIPHNSSTTANAKGRFNINFNYLKIKKFL